MARGFNQECRDLLVDAGLSKNIEVYVKFAQDQAGHEYLFFDSAADDPNKSFVRFYSGEEALAFTRGLITGRLQGIRESTEVLRGLTSE